MTAAQIEYMKEYGTIFLTKEEERDHYSPANILKTAAFIPTAVALYSFFVDKNKAIDSLIIISVVGFIVFFGFYLLVKKSQKNKLRFILFKTNFSESDNYNFSKKALNSLTWVITYDSPGFIRAYNPHKDFRTWGNEMISILISDQKILLNSICNPNGRSQGFLTFGKNEENVSDFIKNFESATQQNDIPKQWLINKKGN